MYEFLGICVMLAGLLSFNMLATLAADGSWRLMSRRAHQWPAASRAQLLFALRVLPPAGALIVIASLAVPAYLLYEPHPPAEFVSAKLVLLAALSACGIALAGWRGLRSWQATRRLALDWIRASRTVQESTFSVPIHLRRHDFPLIAVAGAFRPRLLLSENVLQALSRDELYAALVHERGHIAARDNLKRGILRACHDALTIVPCGRALDRAWAQASEAAADEYAARTGAATALNLAAALVKIARLVPAGARPTMTSVALLMGADAIGLDARVRRLLELAGGESSLQQPVSAWPRFAVRASLAGFILLGALLIAETDALVAVHSVLEQIVSVLQ